MKHPVPDAAEEVLCGEPRVAADADVVAVPERLDAPDALGVQLDLDDAGVLGPVVEPVLWVGAEGAETRPEDDDAVGLGVKLKNRLG